MVDYIHPEPCKKCGAYRHKSEFSVGREWCAVCEKARYGDLYVPSMDEMIRLWQEEANYAKMVEGGIVIE